jgi:hypothetical protein
MDEPIEETYFNWLYNKVAHVDVPTPSLTYYTLLRDLHSTEFVWLIPGDDNRAQDGMDIRREFLTQAFLQQDPPWMSIGCSVLEMLIAFSRTAEFETDVEARIWFWIFMANLRLDSLNDAKRDISRRVANVMDRFIWRTYNPDGNGGLFPLKYPEHDQRTVEIWYQFCAYLSENESTL